MRKGRGWFLVANYRAAGSLLIFVADSMTLEPLTSRHKKWVYCIVLRETEDGELDSRRRSRAFKGADPAKLRWFRKSRELRRLTLPLVGQYGHCGGVNTEFGE